MIICGIDPGTTGALAIIDDDGGCETVGLPVINGSLMAFAVHDMLLDKGVEFAVLEHAQSMPGNGGKAMFSYGQNFGQILTTLQTSYVPFVLVKPAMWKKQMGLTGKGKDASRRMATERFPNAADQFKLVKDHNRAEAALIAWWWRHHPLRETQKVAA